MYYSYKQKIISSNNFLYIRCSPQKYLITSWKLKNVNSTESDSLSTDANIFVFYRSPE